MHLAHLHQNVQPQGQSAPPAPQGTPGIAVQSQPAPQQQQSGGSPYISLLMLLAFAPLLFVMFRRNKKESDARAKLKKGDKVVSHSGLVGELMEMEERFAKVKLGPGNTVTMLSNSIQPLESAAAPKADGKDLKDLKDAKAVAEKK
ncbi:MAG TPA: preprotein translocase subunit YajC [Polyangiaceae bacterium]